MALLRVVASRARKPLRIYPMQLHTEECHVRRFWPHDLRHFSSVVARFKNVDFSFGQKELLQDASFSVRGGSKVTIMGQNGSGKSTILKLLSGDLSPMEGDIHVDSGEVIAVAKQTMPHVCRGMTVKDFFSSQFDESSHPGAKLEGAIAKALARVQLVAPLDRIVGSFSGGQQARLLLSAALITDPTILLLDEPTNNLDKQGINHLRKFISETSKTCLVISHDEEFLNSFTDSVLYLDVFQKQVETYNGDYWFVKQEIAARMARENAQNTRLRKEAASKKAQAGVFANKGGGMRKVAKRMREAAAGMEEEMVDVRREDIALKDFQFPFSINEDYEGETRSLMTVSGLISRSPASGKLVASRLQNKRKIELRKGTRLHVHGPNGIGKTTFLERMATGSSKATGKTVRAPRSTKIGYYRQDFTNFDATHTVLQCLRASADKSGFQITEQKLRQVCGVGLSNIGWF